MSQCTSVTVGSDPRQHLLIAPESKSGGDWLVIIHGGAWRAPVVTSESGVALMNQFRARFNGAASVDYRLSPQVVHPDHMLDVLACVKYICKTYAPDRIVLIGHSAGAFLAGQLADPKLSSDQLPPVAVIGLEGIYSLSDMIAEYPGYRFFVEDAFGPEKNWEAATPDWANLRVPIAAVQSAKDELLSMRQTTWLEKTAHAVRVVVLESGLHDEVFEKMNLVSALSPVIDQLLSSWST